jgi:iron complex transport system ATP-binding protein
MPTFTVQVKNATVYLKDTAALSDINWKVKPLENWAVVGNNGSGKTTLLKLVFGDLLPVEGGEIHWFGSRVWRGLMDIRQKVGFVSAEFQENYDRNVTALEVVESGLFSTIGVWEPVKPHQQKTALDQMRDLGILSLQNKRFRELSYGEARRVLLARALVHRPSLLILDEPCSGLDIPTREKFLQTLQKLSSRVRLIYVTHHVEEILPAISHVLLLKRGRVYRQGPKQEILTDKTLSGALGCTVHLEEREDRFWLAGCTLPKKTRRR